ncbi:MAG: hypothetical protein NTX25_01910 [Proteobacteria bacterium]|nr:hypothetical protein [Pseudomonadota bacterium]
MDTDRIQIKTSLPKVEVELLKSWAIERQTTVTAILRQLIQYGQYVDSIEKDPDRRFLVEEADGRIYEIRWVDSGLSPQPATLES